MKIDFVEIQNFRKLRACRVEIAAHETIFVGANNSGKTSAMDALILFLKKNRRKDIATTDFTLSNWLSMGSQGAYACTLGGPDRRTLFICVAPDFQEHLRKGAGEAAIWAVKVEVPGAGLP